MLLAIIQNMSQKINTLEAVRGRNMKIEPEPVFLNDEQFIMVKQNSGTVNLT